MILLSLLFLIIVLFLFLLFYYDCFVLLFYFISIIVLLWLFHFILVLFSLLLFLFVLCHFIIIFIVIVIVFFIIIITVLLPVQYFGAMVMYSSCFCILFSYSGLCWTKIQSCDYDWTNIFHVMDCMYNAWGSLELASKCQKPVVVMLLVWRLAAWGVLLHDQGKPEKLGTHGTWQKMWSRQAKKIW